MICSRLAATKSRVLPHINVIGETSSSRNDSSGNMSSISQLELHLQHHYGIRGVIEKLPEGQASNYLVSSSGIRWLLKVFQPEITAERARQASDFLRYLVREDYPVREYQASRDGERVLTLDTRAAVLISWIDGQTPKPNSVWSSSGLNAIGALCGKLHRLGAGYLPSTSNSLIHAAEAERTHEEQQNRLERIATEPSCTAEIQEEVRVRIKILSSLGAELDRSRNVAKRGIIGGDFYCAHVVFHEGRSIGVIDVLGGQHYLGWELMRAFFQSIVMNNPQTMTIEESWPTFLAGYASEQVVEPDDLVHAYDVYLLQLAGSTYGLRQPLDDGLRRFGRWRSELSCALAARRSELRSIMTSYAVR